MLNQLYWAIFHSYVTNYQRGILSFHPKECLFAGAIGLCGQGTRGIRGTGGETGGPAHGIRAIFVTRPRQRTNSWRTGIHGL